MENTIQVSGYGYIIINSIGNVFDRRLKYYSLKYLENNAEMFNVKFDIRTFTSLLSSLFAMQSYIQGDENYQGVIPIYPENGTNISIFRNKGDECVTIFIAGSGFKMENGYIGRIFSLVEEIFLE